MPKKTGLKIHRPSPAIVISIAALFVALGGSATAAIVVVKKPRQLGNSVVTSSKIANYSIRGKDIKKNTIPLNRLRGSAAGPKGEKGDTGSQGSTGPQGPPGADGLKGDTGDKGDPGDEALVYAARVDTDCNVESEYAPISGVNVYENQQGGCTVDLQASTVTEIDAAQVTPQSTSPYATAVASVEGELVTVKATTSQLKPTGFSVSVVGQE